MKLGAEVRTLYALAAIAASTAAPSESTAQASQAPPRATVRAVVIDRGMVDGKRRFDLTLERGGINIGAYQGLITFKPGVLNAIEARTRGGDGTRFVNAADTAKGTIRFAGYTVTPQGFVDDVMATILTHYTGSATAAGFNVSLEAVADANGSALKRAQILPFGGVRRNP